MSEKKNFPSCHRGPSGNAKPSSKTLSVRIMIEPLIERALGPHRFDVGRAVTEQSGQQLIGMLSEQGRRRFHFARRRAHPPWDSAMLPLTDLRMLAIHEVAALGQMRILGYVLAVRACRRGDARVLQLRDCVGDAPARSPLGDYRLQRVFI